jgi:hypothetical protein
LDVEAERVRDRVKEESRVVEFVIEKHKKARDVQERLNRECETLLQKMNVHS